MSARLARSARAGLAALALALGWAAGAAPASAQHPVVSGARPLHRRIPLADHVVVVEVESVGTGRLVAVRRDVLSGDVPGTFQVKLPASAPPPLAPGDRALLLLRGARPPYVLVDEPGEVIRLADAEMEARWSRALRRVVAERSRPTALAPVYLDWIDAGPETLREAGLRGLLDDALDDGEVRAEVARDRARAAADPARDPDARRVSALLAVRTAEGAGLLLPRVPGADAQPAVVTAALRGGAAHRDARTLSAFERALAHGDAAVRRAALQTLPALAVAFESLPLATLEQLAEHDPDDGVRRRASRALQALAAAGRGRGAPPEG